MGDGDSGRTIRTGIISLLAVRETYTTRYHGRPISPVSPPTYWVAPLGNNKHPINSSHATQYCTEGFKEKKIATSSCRNRHGQSIAGIKMRHKIKIKPVTQSQKKNPTFLRKLSVPSMQKPIFMTAQ